jgi:hypothetical protein
MIALNMYLRTEHHPEPVPLSEIGRNYLVAEEPFVVGSGRTAVTFGVRGVQATFEIRLKAGTYAAGDRVEVRGV